MSMLRRFAVALIVAGATALSAPTGALAVNPDEMLADPALESRARDLSKGLRCLVCQNESIDESNADLARDLRLLVRERLTEGDSDQEVLDYVVARYGDYVLLSPPVQLNTYLLWGSPAILAILGVLAVMLFYRSRRPAAAPAGKRAPLTEDERKRLESLLKK